MKWLEEASRRHHHLEIDRRNMLIVTADSASSTLCERGNDARW